MNSPVETSPHVRPCFCNLPGLLFASYCPPDELSRLAVTIAVDRFELRFHLLIQLPRQRSFGTLECFYKQSHFTRDAAILLGLAVVLGTDASTRDPTALVARELAGSVVTIGTARFNALPVPRPSTSDLVFDRVSTADNGS